MNIPIVIPTRKGFDCDTLKFLELQKINLKRIFIFIEPQFENLFEKLKEKYNIILLKENNKGIGYSRNSIINYFHDRGEKEIFMIDDDIKNIKNISNPLTYLYDKHIENNSSFSSFNFSFIVFVRKKKDKLINNCYCPTTFCLVNVNDIYDCGNFDKQLLFEDDIDMNIRLLLSGKNIYCDNQGIIKGKKMMKNKEGINYCDETIKEVLNILKQKSYMKYISYEIVDGRIKKNIPWKKLEQIGRENHNFW